jgi:surfactin synthase thioesterase subunit
MSGPPPKGRPARYETFAGRTLGALHLREGAAGRPRLACLPHSGGSSRVFAPLAAALPDDWSVRALDAPGHVATRGAPLRSVDAIALAYLHGLPAGALEGAVLVGLSLGGYVAQALARALARRGAAPAALVVLASRPPGERRGDRPSALSDDDLFAWMVGLGGAGDAGGAWREIFDVYKECLRADLAAYETYRPGPGPPPCPALFVGGLDDPHTPPALFDAWARDVAGARVAYAPGGHFAARDRPHDVAALLAPFVEAAWSAAGPGRPTAP